MAVSSGDINGDGYPDVIIGANGGDGASNAVVDAGEVYVFFGGPSFSTLSFHASSLDGSNGFTIYGVNSGDSAGISVSSGDVNCDGYADVLIGASLGSGASNGAANTGEAYVVFGKASGWVASVQASSLDGRSGFTIYGVDSGDAAGNGVSRGDVNGDGCVDVLIGVYGGDGSSNSASNTGEVHVVFGKASGWTPSIEASSLDGSNGFTIYGVDSGDWAGRTVSSGDVNGDGYADVLIGVTYGNGPSNNAANTGEMYIVFGKASGWASTFQVSSLDGSNGFIVYGIGFRDNAGRSVSSGDINGDGYADVLMGMPKENPVTDTGEVYVLFGKASGWTASVQVAICRSSSLKSCTIYFVT
uniref:Integrin alpha-2 domain-containing protein n=3 Tax=Hemiselmis andersenii TaxID=464988 RepID=A0A7S1E2D6_HEMAN|mmetsp:Transcript_34235/g.83309  ORF Transcript_34235/g.83309 Transcript_34235/m.83309 type:complete len:358 (+) Transcript_34235:546-1619(+)